MNNKEILLFLNKLRNNGGAIWFEKGAVQLDAPALFQNKDTADFITRNKNQIVSLLCDNQIVSSKKFRGTVILRNNTGTAFPLSFAQERLWFIEQYEEGTNAYHLPAVFELDSTTSIKGIQYALQQIVSRHEVLRSTIESDDQQGGIQVVHDGALVMEEEELSDKEQAEILIKSDINRPFDLRKEYPIRVKLYHVGGEKKRILLINLHHIAGDGWSMEIFQKELHAYYEAYVEDDQGFCLPSLEIQYKDYACWQRDYLTVDVLSRQLLYWKTRLSGYEGLVLPTDYARPGEIDYQGASYGFTISGGISNRLRNLTQQHGVTLHSVLLSAFHILLGKYTGQDDIVSGSPIANRHHRQTEGLIGFFVNTQVNRTELNEQESFESLIKRVHQEQTEAQAYQDLPFEKLVNELGEERDASRHPIFQVMFSVQRLGRTASQQKKYLRPLELEKIYATAKFDLAIQIDDQEEALDVQVRYATSLFESGTIAQLMDHYLLLLDRLSTAPLQPYSSISLLEKEELDALIRSAKEKEVVIDKTILDLFDLQVKSHGDDVALVFETTALTYRELDETSNQLSHYLAVQYPLRSGDLIGIKLERSEWLIIAVLAVLKTGAAYVPIDPAYPGDRISYLEADAKTVLSISPETISFFIKHQSSYPLTPLSVSVGVESLAYVLYTSGSTGNPKGVQVTHGNVVSLLEPGDYIRMERGDVLLATGSISFDISTFEMFGPLLKGAKLVLIAKDKLMDLSLLGETISKHAISIVHFIPALLNQIIDESPSVLSGVKILLTGGDKVSGSSISKLRKHHKSLTIIHCYGPTESTTFSTTFSVEDDYQNIPIGKAFVGRKVYVLDKNRCPCPVGVSGELYIGGAGLSRGYLNLKSLSDEKFVCSPFEEGDRLYRSGDVGKRLQDGNLLFLGRKDDQLKIQGHRIEPGEIEHALSKIKGVGQVVVVGRERMIASGSSKYLVAYYVSEGSGTSEAFIVDALSQVLPAYMIPDHVIELKSLPLTANGKLDKKSLPEPETTKQEEYVAPGDEQEALVCRIWEEVLGVEKVGIRDNFFKIGGNSILAIQVSHRMSQALGCKIKVAEVFKYPTCEKLLDYKEINNSILKFVEGEVL